MHARTEASGILRELRTQLRAIEETSGNTGSRREQRDLRARVDEAQNATATALGSPARAVESAEPAIQALRPGAPVQILSLQQQGTVLSTRDGEAEVQFGQFTMRVPTDDLEVLSKRQREPERRVEVHVSSPAPPMELDVRGWRADDAVREVDQYLHDNYVHGQGTVRIVHGKGTGALRKAIREQLETNPLVQSHATEQRELGGDGVTVVTLAV